MQFFLMFPTEFLYPTWGLDLLGGLGVLLDTALCMTQEYAWTAMQAGNNQQEHSKEAEGNDHFP